MKYYLIICLLMVQNLTVSACDFCNCYLGLNPGYNKNTIGVRGNLRFSSLDIPSQNLRLTHLGHDTPTPVIGGTLYETISSFDLFAKVYPMSKLQILFNLPYSINTIEYHDTIETRSALSDLTLMAMYQLANTMPHDSAAVRHRLFAGVGIKLPTGKYIPPSDVTIPMSDHLYSGTGSTDLIFSVSYIGKFRKLGWNADVSYKFNTENNLNYRYGNTINVTPRVFYEWNLKSFVLYPHVGSAYENGAKDVYNGTDQQGTGGSMIYGSGGLDVYYKMISVSSDIRLPVYENLAEGMPVDKSWFIASLNFHF